MAQETAWRNFLFRNHFSLDGIDDGFACGVGAGVLVEPEEVAFGADAEIDEAGTGHRRTACLNWA